MELNTDILSEVIKWINLIRDDYRLITLISIKYVSSGLKKLINVRPKYLEMKRIFSKLVRDGNLELIKVFVGLGFKIRDKTMCSYAAEYGHLEILKWARKNKYHWDFLVCSNAARGGHFEILKWARENGCDWDYRVCVLQQKMVILKY